MAIVELPLVNDIRERVGRWRRAGSPGTTRTTLELQQERYARHCLTATGPSTSRAVRPQGSAKRPPSKAYRQRKGQRAVRVVKVRPQQLLDPGEAVLDGVVVDV